VLTDSSSRSVVKPGDVLDGRYRIVRALGMGSMGAVFLAEHVLIKRPVAVKVLRPELMGADEIIDDFMADARAAGGLGHPNIVACTDAGFTAGAKVPYLVLEYLQGRVLTDEIYRLGGLPVRRALKIAVQIASALGAAHAADIVHRDLTSDNVFLVDDPDARDLVKVLDFGIARLFGLPDGSREGVVSGAAAFMAPEQLTGTDAVDRRADVYALGAILYEMLTARRPFTDDDRPALVQRVIHEPPPPMQRPDAPSGFEDMLVSRMLAKDPAQRYASMKEVQVALDAFADAARPAGSASGFIAASYDDTQIVDLRAQAVALPGLVSRRSPRLRWLLAALLAAGAGVGAMYLDGQARVAATHADTTALDGDAEKLASLIDGEARAAHIRADAVASTPMLRAAIETDAATLRDMAGSDFIFSPQPGEVLELFQIRDGKIAPLVRIPDTAPAIASVRGRQTRVTSAAGALTIVASAPILRPRGGVGGEVAISIAIDLGALRRRLTDHARGAALVGFGAPLSLVAGDGPAPGDTTVTIPVPLSSDLHPGDVAIQATITVPGVRPELRVVALAFWGLSGVLLALFAASLFRGRTATAKS
jgi:hypothetical protein